jgi:hypothetical protein
MRFRRTWLAGVLVALTSWHAAADWVDLQLVLAVDTSGSIDAEEYRLQQGGYAAAFRDPEIIQAIGSGPAGAIAVTVVEWSNANQQRQVIGWTVLRDAETCRRFAQALAEAGRTFSASTSLAGAIDYAAALFGQSGHEGERRVIDISGDGPNNHGRDVRQARDEADAAGIVINALAILTDEPMLDDYFRENVIAGSGAFALAVRDFDDFARAIWSKLLLEIADRIGPAHDNLATLEPGRGRPPWPSAARTPPVTR